MGPLRLQCPINSRSFESFHISLGSLAKSRVRSGEFKQRIYHLGYMTPSILSGSEEIEVPGWADIEEAPGTSPKVTVQKWPPRHCRAAIIRMPPAISSGSPRARLCPSQQEACVAPCSSHVSLVLLCDKICTERVGSIFNFTPYEGSTFQTAFPALSPTRAWLICSHLPELNGYPLNLCHTGSTGCESGLLESYKDGIYATPSPLPF